MPPTTSTKRQYRLKAKLSVDGMKVLEDEDVEIPNSFYVKSKQKVVQLLASSPEEKVEWQESQTDALGMQAPIWIKDDKASSCMQCSAKFTTIFRRHHCRACGHVVCANCSRHKMALPYDDNRMNRVCDKCYNLLSQGGSARTKLTCGFLHISTDTKHWQKQYFVIQNDFVLYAFKDAETSIPLSGYTVVMATEADLMTRDNVLKLFCVAQNKTFYFQAEDRLDLRRSRHAQGVSATERYKGGGGGVTFVSLPISGFFLKPKWFLGVHKSVL
ncbi:FYVE, RhoGEF and PH domain-containing protein 2 [Lamellibrachia satsuma]|nr:FYVE, RhoGEF and PH domain-containing protein 2 [Lamellibrachia satsuma]